MKLATTQEQLKLERSNPSNGEQTNPKLASAAAARSADHRSWRRNLQRERERGNGYGFENEERE